MNNWQAIWHSLVHYLKNKYRYVVDVESKLTQREFETLQSRFVEAGCKVSDLDESSFEITRADYPVVTRIYANPFYLEWSTVIEAQASAKHDNDTTQLLDLVNRLNLDSSLAKFVVDMEDQDSGASLYLIIVTTKLISGAATREFMAESLSNFHVLWSQDIANATLSDSTFELAAMLRV